MLINRLLVVTQFAFLQDLHQRRQLRPILEIREALSTPGMRQVHYTHVPRCRYPLFIPQIYTLDRSSLLLRLLIESNQMLWLDFFSVQGRLRYRFKQSRDISYLLSVQQGLSNKNTWLG